MTSDNSDFGGCHVVCMFCGKLSPGGKTSTDTANASSKHGWKRVRTEDYDNRRWACRPCRHANSTRIIHSEKHADSENKQHRN